MHQLRALLVRGQLTLSDYYHWLGSDDDFAELFLQTLERVGLPRPSDVESSPNCQEWLRGLAEEESIALRKQRRLPNLEVDGVHAGCPTWVIDSGSSRARGSDRKDSFPLERDRRAES
jgi:hypothetical protein